MQNLGSAMASSWKLLLTHASLDNFSILPDIAGLAVISHHVVPNQNALMPCLLAKTPDQHPAKNM